jgi:hypothetical protein
MIILIILLFLIFGGGGSYYGYSHAGPLGGISVFGLVLLLLVMYFLFGNRQ